MPKRFGAQPPAGATPGDDPWVLVDWTHDGINSGFVLTLRRSRPMVALEEGRIETEHLLLTRGQAMALGRSLIAMSGGQMPRGSLLRRLRKGLIARWLRR